MSQTVNVTAFNPLTEHPGRLQTFQDFKNPAEHTVMVWCYGSPKVSPIVQGKS